MKPRIKPEGVVIEPDLHDGLLLGLILSEDRKDLTLLCRHVDGREYKLTVPELHCLRVDNFLEGNIIFEILVREGDQCPAELLQKVSSYDDDTAREHLPARFSGNQRRTMDPP